MHILKIIDKYKPRNLDDYAVEISRLKTRLTTWAGEKFLSIHESGSRAKGTAISISSDVDYLVSLYNDQRSTLLGDTYDSLCYELGKHYPIQKQNVSIRIQLQGRTLLADPLEVDVTPGRKWSGNTNDHSVYVSKEATWKKTNIQKHINDIKNSGRINEIKLLKIWRELNGLDFPSIYLEYLLVDVVLFRRPLGAEYLKDNFLHILNELAKTNENPLLTSSVKDPANSGNILSNLLTQREKDAIHKAAKQSLQKKYLEEILQ